jgi:uncharacterized protein (TIGR02001 family)
MPVMRLSLVFALAVWAGTGLCARAADTDATEPAPASEPAPDAEAQPAEPAAPTPAFTGQVAVVSDYVYRGVSYSQGHPALQASASWSNANGSFLSGLHIDGWGSSVDYGPDDPARTEFSATLAYYGGSDAFNYDVGVTYIVYPGVPAELHYSYPETYLTLGTKVGTATLTATGAYSPNYSGQTGKPWFAEIDGQMPVFTPVKLSAVAGYAALPLTAGQKYTFWGVGAEADVLGFTLGLRYAGNNLEGCCNARVVASIAKSF